MRNGEEKQTKQSILRSEIARLAETFLQRAASPNQIDSYIAALEEFSDHELRIGFARAIRLWVYSTMPPPGYIRKCILAEMEIEFGKRPGFHEADPGPREWTEEDEEISRKFRAQWLIDYKPPEPKKFVSGEVCATRERMELLQKQKAEVIEKYGKRPIVRVRNPASPETNEGNGGKK